MSEPLTNVELNSILNSIACIIGAAACGIGLPLADLASYVEVRFMKVRTQYRSASRANVVPRFSSSRNSSTSSPYSALRSQSCSSTKPSLQLRASSARLT